MVFTTYPFEEAFKKARAKRVSDRAMKKLSEVMENIATQVLLDAKEYARISGRKTVKKSDVKKAFEIFKRYL